MFTTYNSNGEYAEIYNAKELSKKVFDSIEYYERAASRAQRENDHLKREALAVAEQELKDEIARLKAQLDMSYGSFASKKEKQAYEDFEQRHIHRRNESKAQGGMAPYLIPTGTGIGTILHVKCPICGAEENITDTEAW